MIPTSLLTIRNIIILWNIYNYYVYADAVYKGVYYTGKVIKFSKNTVEYLLIDKIEKNKKEDEKDKKEISQEDDWVLL